MKSHKTSQVKYYTVKEVAEMLRMHPVCVRKAITDHKLGALRKGPRGKYLITPKQIEAYLVPAGADWITKRQ
jgi:excisionase family DNA binding protein